MFQVHVVLKDLVRKSIGETEVASLFHYSQCFRILAIYDKHPILEIKEKIDMIFVLWGFQQLRRFPTLQTAIATAANESLERFREDGRSTALRLVEMEATYPTVEFFRNRPQDLPAADASSKAGAKPSADSRVPLDRYGDGHYRNIASNVSQYIRMVGDELLKTIPKAAVHCQVREAKRSLLNHFYVQIGKKEVGHCRMYCFRVLVLLCYMMN